MNIGAIPLTPELIVSGLSILSALWSALRGKRYRDAAETVITGIEYAGRYENNAKRAVKMTAAGAVLRTIDSILREKGFTKK